MSAEAPLPSRPTLMRKVIAGCAVLAFAIAVLWFVEWRSAPPPPPHPVGQFP
jgi:hypothetical protein